MRHLMNSFQTHVGERGCHFYDDSSCNFLSWKEVFSFIKTLPQKEDENEFGTRLTETLANYDPNKEYLAVQQKGSSISVELYSITR